MLGYNSTPNTEVRFTLEPNTSFDLLLEFSYGLNWYVKGNNYTSSKPNFALGLGTFRDLKYFELTLLVKYMNQTGNDVKMDSYLISANMFTNVLKNIFFTVSWNYYFNGIKIKNSVETNVLYLGLGYNINSF